jgi:hypothetical protein
MIIISKHKFSGIKFYVNFTNSITYTYKSYYDNLSIKSRKNYIEKFMSNIEFVQQNVIPKFFL